MTCTRFATGSLAAAVIAGIVMCATGNAAAQAAPASGQAASAQATTAQPAGESSPAPRKTYTVPAGTKVLLELRSAIDTRSAKPGDGVYLVSTFPVVLGTRVLIPAGVYVQGVIDRVKRAGRIHGRAQLDMHFTSIIFPNGTVVEVPGVVNSLPGSREQTVKKNGEGTIEEAPRKGRHAGDVGKVTVPTGGTVGAIGGVMGGHPMMGTLAGVAGGLAAMGIVSLFTRGADVDIPKGTQVEMVLQRPLILQRENLAGSPGATYVPAPNQPKPMKKPKRMKILCPPGGLGCQ